MKTILLTLIPLAALVAVVGVVAYDVLAAQGGHDRAMRGRRVPFAANEMSREEYIQYLLRTEKHDNPELWVRIAAVKNLKRWPE